MKYTATDATQDAWDAMSKIPDSRKDEYHTVPGWDSWDVPDPLPLNGIADGVNYIKSTPSPIADGSPAYEMRKITPQGKTYILKLADSTGKDVIPTLLATWWPRNLLPGNSSKPTPFLVYFHANVGQGVQNGNYQGPGLGTYPFGYDYLHYGLWTYLNYFKDSIATGNVFNMGIPYQIRAAARDVVLVLPSSKVGEEVGVFTDAEAMSAILLEVQRCVFKLRSEDPPTEIGDTALAGFSASNGLVSQFLSSGKNLRHPFCKKTLREVYLFDPPGNVLDGAVNSALAWLATGEKENKMARLYTQHFGSSLAQLAGGSANMKGATLLPADDWLKPRTSFYLPQSCWYKPFHDAWTHFSRDAHPDSTDAEREDYWNKKVKPTVDWRFPHAWIPQTMLTDALRRSNFPTSATTEAEEP